jgi:hypothetical protein
VDAATKNACFPSLFDALLDRFIVLYHPFRFPFIFHIRPTTMASSTEQEEEITTPYTAQQTEVPSGAAATGVGYDDERSSDVSSIQFEREGHLCFGVLFDMRIGTIGTNIMNCFVKIICIAFELSWGNLYPVGTAYCSLILSMIAIFSALYFEHIPAYVSSASFAMIALIHFIGGAQWFAIIWDCLIIYPTLVIGYQIQKGVMTKGTYQYREEYVAPEIRKCVEYVSI